jgi:hypothetical protein
MHIGEKINHFFKTKVYHAEENLRKPIFCIQFLGIPPISYIVVIIIGFATLCEHL